MNILKKSIAIASSILISLSFSTKDAFAVPDEAELNWYYVNRGIDKPLDTPKESQDYLKELDGYYLADTDKKVLYLTFDEGYENGNTPKILDILKEEGVPAAFFIVKPYIRDYPDLVKRMESEGHLVCNHTSTHPSMASIRDDVRFRKEFSDVEEAYTALIGKEMPKYFRPPMGKYSKTSLKKTKDLGYKTIFWSFAYKDWVVEEQPSEALGIKKITEGVRPGTIMLLHAVSSTNTKILKPVLQKLKADGYEFKSLDEFPFENS